MTDMATRVPLDSVAALLCPPEFYGTVETTIYTTEVLYTGSELEKRL